MDIKRSDLGSMLWENYEELRAGMDASHYKDYVLIRQSIKYISAK
jgi:hypothetical protein